MYIVEVKFVLVCNVCISGVILMVFGCVLNMVKIFFIIIVFFCYLFGVFVKCDRYEDVCVVFDVGVDFVIE